MSDTSPEVSPSSQQLAELVAQAQAAAHHAYAPYSRFFVGAALLLENGATTSGANVENSSYRLTTCAEQAAVAVAISQYGPSIRVRAVAIQNLNHAPCQPCGACLQTLAEFALPTASIIYPGVGDRPCTRSLASLLPDRFVLTPELEQA